jgi:hypothetical protein
MSFDLDTSYNGAATGGLTSPTYNPEVDVAPNVASRQAAITALGGTQTGVDTHSVSKPFTVTIQRPASLKSPATVGVDGILRNNGRNRFVVRTRKGVVPVSGQSPQVMLIETTMSIPAGADVDDVPNVEAAISAHIGYLTQEADQVFALAVSGVI